MPVGSPRKTQDKVLRKDLVRKGTDRQGVLGHVTKLPSDDKG